jgi:predicted acyl esterase
MIRVSRLAIALVWVLVVVCQIRADEPQQKPDLPQLFVKKEVMIPMRDGVKLHTEIYTPRDAKSALPIFIERSPYGISASDKGYSPALYRYSEMFGMAIFLCFRIFAGATAPRAISK